MNESSGWREKFVGMLISDTGYIRCVLSPSRDRSEVTVHICVECIAFIKSNKGDVV